MNKRNTVILCVLIVIAIVLIVVSVKNPAEVAPGFPAPRSFSEVGSLGETDKSTKEESPSTETTEEDIPAEFEDNLDDAFKDLDAVDW